VRGGVVVGEFGVFWARERRRDTDADLLDQNTATPVDRADDAPWFHQPGWHRDSALTYSGNGIG
jgi:hypothetical protein